MAKTIKVTVHGRGEVSLRPEDLIQSGGEGSVYRNGNLAYKIYHEPKRMVPTGKLAELGALSRDNILSPQHLLLDSNRTPVGFAMRMAPTKVVLCELFTNSFRDRNGITADSTLELVEAMKETISYVHQHQCLIVDCNEFNFLVDEKKYTTPYCIDVDSWQTPSFPATAIMPSIRDWNAKEFTELSDWFSFAILACQLFIGIHPFKGTHPDFKKRDMEARARRNISVFNKKTAYPPAVRDFSYIPKNYMDWFIKLFERGAREFPPGVAGTLQVAQIQKVVVESSDNFVITFAGQVVGDVVEYREYMGADSIITKEYFYINGNKSLKATPKPSIIFTPTTLQPILVEIKDFAVQMLNLKTGDPVPINLTVQEKFVVDNTLYLKNQDKMYEMVLNEMGAKIIPSVKTTWSIMPNSARIFRNFIVQDMLGKTAVVIPQPANGKPSQCMTKILPELQGYKFVDGRYENHVLMLTGNIGVPTVVATLVVSLITTAQSEYWWRPVFLLVAGP